jgi:type IV pilus assembly protein PilM
MFKLSKKCIYPIGIDLGDGYIKMAQLGLDAGSLYLHAAAVEGISADIDFGSSDWQRYVARAVKEMVSNGGFSGKAVMASLPSQDLFIEQIRVESEKASDVDAIVREKIGAKLPFNPADALIKNVVIAEAAEGGQMDVLVMAAEKNSIDRHIAIYEKAGLEVHGMGVWPVAMVNSYANFFGRRDSDQESVAMLINIGIDHSYIAMCRHTSLLFARTIPVGANQFDREDMVCKLVSEVDACCHYFESISGGGNIERLVFLAGKGVDENICQNVANLAQRMQVAAQIGDVLGAVDVHKGCKVEVDRRGSNVDWAMTFGLSLPEKD